MAGGGGGGGEVGLMGKCNQIMQYVCKKARSLTISVFVVI